MCNHCRSVRGNPRNNDEKKSIKPSREIPAAANAFGQCCQWRQTCCGGGCCDSVNCCGTGSSNPNTGYNIGYNSYGSRTPPSIMGIEMNCGNGQSASQRNTNAPVRRGTPPDFGPINDEDTIPCVTSKKEKYCVGGDCYLDEEKKDGGG